MKIQTVKIQTNKQSFKANPMIKSAEFYNNDEIKLKENQAKIFARKILNSIGRSAKKPSRRKSK